ncbi:ArsR/SmtB family transcription factor [Crassaminicella profunda]|uniref:ArsR/SmtB family transcription factor n=1 Tax=Crassaminicella profunda TaxID=1286698 RepID=UPI001CA6A4F4|nr:metalloregulator ArsR/SmtB family transcription factor [Crassaminicella profunda]QZY54505.1 metalloregulator ArsR/SmtB family transcription factor [Crassaminicella profunda]
MSGINENSLDVNVLKAMADEIRMDILYLLKMEEMNVNDLAEQFDISRPTVSHHLQILKRANLVYARKEGKEIYYSINIYAITSLAEGLLRFISI